MHAATPPLRERLLRHGRTEPLLVTGGIVVLTVAVYVFASLRDGDFGGHGATNAALALYGPKVHAGEWWRLFTDAVVHFGFIHILFNMLVLWQVGRVLEPGAGHARFAALYVVSVLAGSAGALVLTPHDVTGGASGGVFGVAAAATIVMQRQGIRFWDTGFGPLVLINLAYGFFVPGISVGGHLGGLVGGALATEAMLQARRAAQPWLGYAGAAFVGAGSVLLAFTVAAR